jgi:hypothetical protein
MSLESQRRRFLWALNSRYIYGRVVSRIPSGLSPGVGASHCNWNECLHLLQPLLNAIVFLLQMMVVSILTRRYNSYYAARPGEMGSNSWCRGHLANGSLSSNDDDNERRTPNPVQHPPYYALRLLTSNSQVLGGIADTVAQTLTSVRQKAVRKPTGLSKDSDFIAIEIHELDKKNPFGPEELIPDSLRLPPPFDFERLTRFMAYGFLMAPVQHKWFSFLSKTFPLTKANKMSAALKRVAFDQLLFSPTGMLDDWITCGRIIFNDSQVSHASSPS